MSTEILIFFSRIGGYNQTDIPILSGVIQTTECCLDTCERILKPVKVAAVQEFFNLCL